MELNRTTLYSQLHNVIETTTVHVNYKHSKKTE